jgi:HK97 family phage portal protein
MKNNILTVMQKAFSGNFNTVSNRHGWMPFVSEAFSGAWQRNIEVTKEDMLAYPAVFSCITLISSDIAKLNLKLVQLDQNGIWTETTNAAYSPVLRKPNRYQNRIQFFQSWLQSLLINGNTYVLKERDNRNVVIALYILDPLRVNPAVAPDGSIWYDVPSDELSGTNDGRILRIPASEIIHDRYATFYHDLIGVSPLYAAALSVSQGSEIQKNSAAFFKNNARPGGILTAPGAVSDETVEQLRQYWEANYTGNNAGKVAVLADGLTYKSFEVQTQANAQVIEQLKWSSEVVCSVFHVPPYKIGVGNPPTGGGLEAENIRYYSEAIQIRIESIELLLDEGLNMASNIGVYFDLNDLIKMDTKTLIENEEIAVGAGIKKLNEARKTINLAPMEGGESAYLQQQNYSVAALAKRDTGDDPFGTNKTSTANTSSNTNDNQEEDDATVDRFITELRLKTAERFIYAK